jgi:hypothetical protein
MLNKIRRMQIRAGNYIPIKKHHYKKIMMLFFMRFKIVYPFII